MDKKSNRTDLLAAGREKLRQYRQKKDTKGKDGKGKDGKGSGRSTNKVDRSGKSDAVDKANVVPKTNAESSKSPAVEIEVNSSVSATVETHVESSTDSQKESEHGEGSASNFHDTDQPVPFATDVGEPAVRDIPSSDLDPLVAEGSSSHELEYNVPNGKEHVNVDAHEGFIPVSSALEIVHGDLITHNPDSSSGTACGAAALLIADVLPEDGGDKGGAMHEADEVISEHHDQSAEVEMVRESKVSASDGGSETPAVPHNIPSVAAGEYDVDHDTVNASDSVEAIPIAVEAIAENPEKVLKEWEGAMDGASNDGSLYLESVSNDCRSCENEKNMVNLERETDENCGKQYPFDGPSMIAVETSISSTEHQNVYPVEEQSVCPDVQGSHVNLVMLAEVLKQLPDGDFRYLIKAREVMNSRNVVPNNEGSNLHQILQEQLYNINILKDLFSLQLVEQHERQTDVGYQHHLPLDQVPELTSPPPDFEERYKSLAAELSECRSELEIVTRERGELQSLYNIVKQDAVDNSSKVDELKIKLVESAGQLSSLTGELVSRNVLFDVLHQENKKLLESLSSVAEQRNKFEEVMQQCIQENKKLFADLADSAAQLAALQLEISNLKMSLASLNDERDKLEEEKDSLVQEKEMLLGELADCKSVKAALQLENAGLNVNLATVAEEHDKLKKHEEHLTQEIERLSGELIASKENMPMHVEHIKLEADLKEAMSRLEQLAEENIILQSSLEIHKAKLAEIDSRQNQLSSQALSVGTGSGCEDNTDTGGSYKESCKDGAEFVVPSAGTAPDACCESAALDKQGDVPCVAALKGCLEEADKMMQQLDDAINGMHSQSETFRRSAGKGSTPGVSKLIQAFESKANTDDHEPEETKNLLPFDPYSLAKGNISHLRTVIRSLAQNVQHVNALIMEEKEGHKAANVAREELEVEIEALNGITCNLEMRNIELEVLCGAMSQHAHDIEAKKVQLESLCEDLKQQELAVQSQNTELVKKLADCHLRIGGLQFQLSELRRSSVDLASAINDEVQTLQKEIRDDIYAIDGQWKFNFSMMVPMVEKLNNVVGSATIIPRYCDTSDELDMFSHFAFSLNSACEVIEQLKIKLEALEKNYEELSILYGGANEKLLGLSEEHNSAVAVLNRISGDLINLLNVSGEGIEGSEIQAKEYDMLDPLDYDSLVAKLGSLFADLLQLKESHSRLQSDLLSRTNNLDELKERCLDEDVLLKLVLDVREVLQLQDTEISANGAPALVLQSAVSLLIQKYKEAEFRVNVLSNDVKSRTVEIAELSSRVEQLDSLTFQQQNEILVLKESLMHAKNSLDNMQADLISKTRELELSEQRVASVREKLSIAVAKGKGLVAQRDSLKQSLAEMSAELENYLQELQLKDSRIQEVEEKLKAYSEAGERMEALESELSYIRNSATALRESFVLKDSSLQRIEEILEDLELPDHFHSKDIIEKVDWLAKSVTVNSSLPVESADWDQRTSVEAASYSDVGFVVSDECKEDAHPPNPVDDLRRKYEDLQTKFYELAEQNDMLEQSLMERNVLVQRWEEILDRINTPPQIRSMEPEERIHWLGTAVSEADNHMRSLQQKVENLENYCGSLSVDLEESQRQISELEASLQAVLHEKKRALSEAEDNVKSLLEKTCSLESYCSSLSAVLEESQRRTSELESSCQVALLVKETLSCRLVELFYDHEIAMSFIAQYEHEINKLEKEISILQGKVAEELRKEGHVSWIESEVRRLQGLIIDILKDPATEDASSDVNDIQYLEMLIGRLANHSRVIDSVSHGLTEAIQDHVPEHAAELPVMAEMDKALLLGEPSTNSRSMLGGMHDVDGLRRQLADAVDEVAYIREERDAYMLKNQYLTSEFEVVDKNRKELQDMLNQEEQKSASLREKLNLAVKRGKAVVQQRDILKQSNEEMGVEIEQLKSKIIDQEHCLLESRQKIFDLTQMIERYKAFESENAAIKNHLTETEMRAQKIGHTLTMLLSKLGEINTGDEIGLDPVQKVEGIAKLCSDLRATGASYEQEAKKSKKAAELLLAELNEVQERNDALQEELAKTYDEISSLSRERDLAYSAKSEALAHLSKLSEEGRNQLAELNKLNSGAHEVKQGFLEIYTLANDVFSKDIGLLSTVRTSMKACLEGTGSDPVATEDFAGLISSKSGFKDVWSANLSRDNFMCGQLSETVGLDAIGVLGKHLQQLGDEISGLKERIHNHSTSFDYECEQLTNLISVVLRENASQRRSLESIKDDYIHLESIVKERDMEGDVMRRHMSLLFEACSSSIAEIENGRAGLWGESMAARDLRVNLPALPSPEMGDDRKSALASYENCARNLADKLQLAVKDVLKIKTEAVEGHTKELRSTILNLQKELQEKDIQRERLCMELVSQIKEAETTAANYSKDLQSMKNYAQDLESKLEMISKERTSLEQRVEKLQQGHLDSIELGEKVKALTNLVAAKEQEIEALMQALDEEENQMEALRSKVDGLEKLVQQKSTDLEHVEASRSKALKKLSVTVSKFDELHHMSEVLLSEIENLQSQLQDRDAEISFLRQEVTRCTNDALEATKMVKHRNSHEFHELLTWLDAMLSNVLVRESSDIDDNENSDHKYKEHLQKEIMSMISELQDLRVAAQRKDALLQAEKNRVEELLCTKEALEVSLQEKELHLSSLQGSHNSGLGTSEIVEVEPVLNNWTAPVASAASQVRSLRKVNNDQVSIAIDTDAASSGRFDDEDDDKVHGFKSLTTSRFVPKFTRPVSDMVDGLWVSCDRTLMRQPAFRLGIMIYWAVLHALLASFIV